VRFDSGTASYLINSGNKLSAGSFWSARTCKDGELRTTTSTSASRTIAGRRRPAPQRHRLHGRDVPDLSAQAALQHARSHRARPARDPAHDAARAGSSTPTT
jgi:hypothetical protein